jgi:hypothetical protein
MKKSENEMKVELVESFGNLIFEQKNEKNKYFNLYLIQLDDERFKKIMRGWMKISPLKTQRLIENIYSVNSNEALFFEF